MRVRGQALGLLQRSSARLAISMTAATGFLRGFALSAPNGRSFFPVPSPFRRSMGLLLTACFLFLANSALAGGFILEGSVTHIRDGDTIEVSGVLVRLSGVTADEAAQDFGAAMAAK